ncbi:MAG TPA: hypothetical protein VER55_00105 [Ardenticatenaceae bacterium]|nr:hypothetical protein [Ardenticatenaceae bacterium]
MCSGVPDTLAVKEPPISSDFGSHSCGSNGTRKARTPARGYGGAAAIFLAGALITSVSAVVTLWIGYRLFKIPMGLLIGMVAGLQTQPAALGVALEQTGNELPNVGYAAVYPVALIAKILFA